MPRISSITLSLALTGAAVALPAFGQAVVSTRSGVVHFFEGAVTVAGQPLQTNFGRFADVPEGSDLRTDQGRAEILLTPGVFLRVGEKSAIRMVANSLADTRVELLSGSAIVESGEPAAGTAVTLLFKNWKIQQAHQGAYRVDSDPARVEVREGEVKVQSVNGDAPVLVEQGMTLPFETVLAPEKTVADAHDPLNDWAEGRDESISADNAIAENIQDPATMTNPYGLADSFTYFPMLGYPAMGVSLSTIGGSVSPYGALYGASNPLYQPGFYSLYLPGYTYRPVYLRIPTTGIGRSLYLPTSPLRYPGTSVPVRTPIVTRPLTPSTIGHAPAPAVAPHPVVIHK